MKSSNYNSKKNRNKWHEKFSSKCTMVCLILPEVVSRKGKRIRDTLVEHWRVSIFPNDRYVARLTEGTRKAWSHETAWYTQTISHSRVCLECIFKNKHLYLINWFIFFEIVVQKQMGKWSEIIMPHSLCSIFLFFFIKIPPLLRN